MKETGVLLIVLAIVGSPSVLGRATHPLRQRAGINSPTFAAVPSDIKERDVWNEPWVYEAQGPERRALTALHTIQVRQQRVGPIPIRLDDGSLGTMTAEAGSCGPQDACIGPRDDCGCFDDDSYWIYIADSTGRRIKRLHFWAAYGRFQIVPVDIIGGPGDELFIFRVPAHASPQVGYDIKIWLIDQSAPRDLANGEHVAGHIPARKYATSCVLWKTTFSVDLAGAKPRALQLGIDVGTSPGCPASETVDIAIDKLQPKEELRFNSTTGKYVFPAGSILSHN
jgi:hypothetical protein